MLTTFSRLIENGNTLDKETPKSLLIIYEDEIVALGDCCVRFDKLRYFKSYFPNASIEINFTNQNNLKFADGFLQNNPHIQSYFALPWGDIDFYSYDLIFLAASDEPAFLLFLEQEHGEEIQSGELPLAVFSISKLILKPAVGAQFIFPVIEELITYFRTSRPGELYISEEERNWGDLWLFEHGLKKEEDLYIVVDSSAVRSKLLNMSVHINLLRNFLQRPNTKVLIFDEKDLGKEQFYRKCLGENSMNRILFSKKLTLRQDLCLLASRNTRLVFGPCTGLMHCASSIYNKYAFQESAKSEVPPIVVYTGRYDKEHYNVNVWWGSSPLVTCLLLLQGTKHKEIVRLSELPAAKRIENNALPCSEYTCKQVIEVIDCLVTERFQTN